MSGRYVMDAGMKSELLSRLALKLEGEIQSGTVGTDALNLVGEMVRVSREPLTRPTEGSCMVCGERVRKMNPHRMDVSKVKLLTEIGRKNDIGIVWVKVQRDGTLIKREDQASTIQCDDVHAMRLKWFGLLEYRGKRSGEYKINDKGRAFLAGKATVPARIFCKNGRVLEESPEKVRVDDVRNVILDKSHWDNYAELQKKEPMALADEPAQADMMS
jgi:hypothetical protein